MTITKLDNGRIVLINGDCLDWLPKIKRKALLVIADLPYGTTAHKWDSVIPLDKLWQLFKQVTYTNANYVFTSSQPFTTTLNASNLDELRHEIIWNKEYAANFAQVKRQPLKIHENISIFYAEQGIYNPQMTQGKPNHSSGTATQSYSYNGSTRKETVRKLDGLKYPKSIITYAKHASQSKHHKTEKPLDLIEYLVKTYSNEENIVIDPTMGSGTSGVACKKLNRLFIGIEKDPDIYAEAVERIKNAN